MEYLAELIFKEFYQKQVTEKPGMKITYSNNGFIQVFPNANLEWQTLRTEWDPQLVHHVQLQFNKPSQLSTGMVQFALPSSAVFLPSKLSLNSISEYAHIIIILIYK